MKERQSLEPAAPPSAQGDGPPGVVVSRSLRSPPSPAVVISRHPGSLELCRAFRPEADMALRPSWPPFLVTVTQQLPLANSHQRLGMFFPLPLLFDMMLSIRTLAYSCLCCKPNPEGIPEDTSPVDWGAVKKKAYSWAHCDPSRLALPGPAPPHPRRPDAHPGLTDLG